MVVQDLANQICWSDTQLDADHGKVISAEAAEWFSGLPAPWTSLEVGHSRLQGQRWNLDCQGGGLRDLQRRCSFIIQATCVVCVNRGGD